MKKKQQLVVATNFRSKDNARPIKSLKMSLFRMSMTVNSTISKSVFGATPKGQEILEFTLTNSSGMRVSILNLGGIIREIWVPDRQGNFSDVVLGFDDVNSYLEISPYMGAVVGRYANRLANAQFELDGVKYPLAANNGTNNLHGGLDGFDKRVWTATTFETETNVGVELNLLSEEGDQGFPGNLNVKVKYQLTEAGEIIVDYFAITDKPTPINLTQHSYFNLAGEGSILEHELQLFSDAITPITQAQIPTGEFLSVDNTPFDFRAPKKLGEHIDEKNEQLEFGFGYDHNFLVRHKVQGDLTLAARLSEKKSGRVMEVLTQEKGIQLYTGNWLEESLSGKGKKVVKRGGVCLEPENYPNAPNQKNFPNSILRPGEEYKTRTVFRFLVE